VLDRLCGARHERRLRGARYGAGLSKKLATLTYDTRCQGKTARKAARKKNESNDQGTVYSGRQKTKNKSHIFASYV
jgi:hypothetical protein